MENHRSSSLAAIAGALAMAIIGGACGDKKSPQAARPCMGLEAQIAKGKTDADVAAAAEKIANMRIGCQEATGFMVLLATALYEQKTQVLPANLSAYGLRWCNNSYAKANGIKKRRTQVRNADMLEGCRLGVNESVSGYTLLTNLYHPQFNAKPVTDDQVESAYKRAQQLAAPIVEQRRQMTTAIERHELLENAKQALAAKKLELANVQSENRGAEARFKDLDARKNHLFADRDQAFNEAESAAYSRRVVENRLRPLQNELAVAQRARDVSLGAKSEAQNNVNRLKRAIETAQSKAQSDRSRAKQLRDDAKSYRDKTPSFY